MLPFSKWSDPRLQPMAYVTTGKTLFEVEAVDKTKGITIVNCKTDERLLVDPQQIVPGWRLVRAAPEERMPDAWGAAA